MSAELVSVEKMQGIWVDVGTPERLEELDNKIKQGEFA